jgi:hypothetical protein
MHYHEIDDERGDLQELVPFCSDSCHVEWCREHNVEYGGWNGAHESDVTEYCANCGVIAGVGTEDDDACEHQRDNVVVNRFTTEAGERCEHGKWIHLPRERISS